MPTAEETQEEKEKEKESNAAENASQEEWIATFWTQGQTPLVVDLIKEMYLPLTCHNTTINGMYHQYFTKTSLEESKKAGVEFYSDKKKYAEWKKGILAECKKVASLAGPYALRR